MAPGSPTEMLDDKSTSGSQCSEKMTQSASLAQRRQQIGLVVNTDHASLAPATVLEKDIVELAHDESIFDIYHWDEVLQEEGNGGKVVVCELKGSPKTPHGPRAST